MWWKCFQCGYDQISYAPSTIEIGVCVEHRHDWIMSIAIGYSFKENNGYSVYLNNTFNGLTPEMNGLLNLDYSDTHVHARRYKIVMIVPPTCGTAM